MGLSPEHGGKCFPECTATPRASEQALPQVWDQVQSVEACSHPRARSRVQSMGRKPSSPVWGQALPHPMACFTCLTGSIFIGLLLTGADGVMMF
eukprot:362102-Chlamydomonas_euryale.AAC.3